MGVYKARRFSQSTKKLGIHDKVLMAAAEEVMQGIWEADLGSGVIKKRLPLQQGKSGGARTIIFFKSANHVFFYDGWSKSGLSSKGTKEIEDDELAAYKKMANAFLAFSNKQIEDLIETGFLIEVINER
ncbi:TPA: type II toxin-antitoxin system RelE/ParE family toxin [Escherichia coli]|nr:type II toxin-antitoxin system RelE/ParE family toxin [Escherichia coli]